MVMPLQCDGSQSVIQMQLGLGRPWDWNQEVKLLGLAREKPTAPGASEGDLKGGSDSKQRWRRKTVVSCQWWVARRNWRQWGDRWRTWCSSQQLRVKRNPLQCTGASRGRDHDGANLDDREQEGKLFQLRQRETNDLTLTNIAGATDGTGWLWCTVRKNQDRQRRPQQLPNGDPEGQVLGLVGKKLMILIRKREWAGKDKSAGAPCLFVLAHNTTIT